VEDGGLEVYSLRKVGGGRIYVCDSRLHDIVDWPVGGFHGVRDE
jgi:hypothetical protein